MNETATHLHPRIEDFINELESIYGVSGGPYWSELTRLARIGAAVESLPEKGCIEHIPADDGTPDWWNVWYDGVAFGDHTLEAACRMFLGWIEKRKALEGR